MFHMQKGVLNFADNKMMIKANRRRKISMEIVLAVTCLIVGHARGQVLHNNG